MPSRPLVAVTLMLAAAGCRAGAGESEQASLSVPQRDLTLQQAAAPDSEVISALEAGRVSSARSVEQASQPPRPGSPRARAVARKSTVAAVAPRTAPLATAAAVAPSSSLGPSGVLAVPADSTSESSAETDDPHALAPGATVTAIPTSQPAGVPGGTDGWSDDPPAGPAHGGPSGGGHGGRRRGGGGGCHGRAR